MSESPLQRAYFIGGFSRMLKRDGKHAEACGRGDRAAFNQRSKRGPGNPLTEPDESGSFARDTIFLQAGCVS
jgi:sugar/nucleoside kinase (ribokinase family)